MIESSKLTARMKQKLVSNPVACNGGLGTAELSVIFLELTLRRRVMSTGCTKCVFVVVLRHLAIPRITIFCISGPGSRTWGWLSIGHSSSPQGA